MSLQNFQSWNFYWSLTTKLSFQVISKILSQTRWKVFCNFYNLQIKPVPRVNFRWRRFRTNPTVMRFQVSIFSLQSSTATCWSYLIMKANLLNSNKLPSFTQNPRYFLIQFPHFFYNWSPQSVAQIRETASHTVHRRERTEGWESKEAGKQFNVHARANFCALN